MDQQNPCDHQSVMPRSGLLGVSSHWYSQGTWPLENSYVSMFNSDIFKLDLGHL